MKREYVIRGERVEIEQIDDVVAVMPSERGIPREEAAGQFGDLAELPATTTDDREHTQSIDWSAFEQAGWLMVYPRDEVRGSLESGDDVPGADQVHLVFRDPNGRLFMGHDRLVVQLRSELSEDEAGGAIEEAGLAIDRPLKFAPNLYSVRVRPGAGRDFLDASVDLWRNPAFLFAEPEFIEHIPPRFTPADPDYSRQWQWKNTGDDGGTPGADVSAEDAWDVTRGAGIRVAVIDQGMNVAHGDLADAIVEDTSGYFVSDPAGCDSFVKGTAGFPDQSHGTFCAGMALARANNGDSGCGIANEADLTAVACLSDFVGPQTTLARAVAIAADPCHDIDGAEPADGADVITCSLGSLPCVPWDMAKALELAIDFAVTHGRGGLGTPVFWASNNGNCPMSEDQVASYVNTIAVGSSTKWDTRIGGAFGPELDFLAPGVWVVSITSNAGVLADMGTSYATPAAAGVGALVLAANPKLTWQQVRDTIRDTCDKVGEVPYDAAGRNDFYGFGRVNAAQAVLKALDAAEPAPTG